LVLIFETNYTAVHWLTNVRRNIVKILITVVSWCGQHAEDARRYQDWSCERLYQRGDFHPTEAASCLTTNKPAGACTSLLHVVSRSVSTGLFSHQQLSLPRVYYCLYVNWGSLVKKRLRLNNNNDCHVFGLLVSETNRQFRKVNPQFPFLLMAKIQEHIDPSPNSFIMGCNLQDFEKKTTVTVVFFTALHEMQTRSSDEKAICLSVRCLSNAWIVTKRKKNCPIFIPTKVYLA